MRPDGGAAVGLPTFGSATLLPVMSTAGATHRGRPSFSSASGKASWQTPGTLGAVRYSRPARVSFLTNRQSGQVTYFHLSVSIVFSDGSPRRSARNNRLYHGGCCFAVQTVPSSLIRPLRRFPQKTCRNFSYSRGSQESFSLAYCNGVLGSVLWLVPNPHDLFCSSCWTRTVENFTVPLLVSIRATATPTDEACIAVACVSTSH